MSIYDKKHYKENKDKILERCKKSYAVRAKVLKEERRIKSFMRKNREAEIKLMEPEELLAMVQLEL